ncbi:NHL repeat-containing protein [Actinomarinicola tropica]|uniref:ScyD/ScyE family protein n=1 Tax=Actinomarinicola tropica TaxID=2789776 RepID=A0A5Q2RKN2_9ACTN|nr:hypothetical protein [Actinomarinicola tropica]QGG93755.1 hypothetical protein GH723_00740 [Actinomarinicola tropica]
MTPRTGRLLGAAMVLLAAVGGVALFVTRDDGGDPAPPPPDDAAPVVTTTTAPPVVGAIDLGSGVTLDPIGEVPGATALSIVDGEVRATDASSGARYVVATGGGAAEVEGPLTFGSQSRLDRSEPTPDGADRWVAEATQLHRIDDEGEILDSVTLEVPGAVSAIDDQAVWLTVSGVPAAHTGGGPGAQSVLQRVDRETLEVVARPLEDPTNFRFALGDGVVWVTVGRTLYRLDPITLEPTGEVELDEAASALLVGADGEVLVVVGGEEPALVRVGPGDLAEIGRVALGPGSVGDAVVVGDRLGRDGEVWITRPSDDAVLRVEPASGAVEEVAVVAPLRVDVDERGDVWLLSGAAGGTLLRAASPTG